MVATMRVKREKVYELSDKSCLINVNLSFNFSFFFFFHLTLSFFLYKLKSSLVKNHDP